MWGTVEMSANTGDTIPLAPIVTDRDRFLSDAERDLATHMEQLNQTMDRFHSRMADLTEQAQSRANAVIAAGNNRADIY